MKTRGCEHVQSFSRAEGAVYCGKTVANEVIVGRNHNAPNAGVLCPEHLEVTELAVPEAPSKKG